jgi:protocatechuate 4,5-dioxygenase alpha chain
VAGHRPGHFVFKTAVVARFCSSGAGILIHLKEAWLHRRKNAPRYGIQKAGSATMNQGIEGSTLFDGVQARRGYALNKMCFSFNDAENRAAFVRDEDGYCAKFGLTPEQRAAVAHRNVLEMIEAGGNVCIGAQQTGMSVEAFKAKLRAAGR